MDKALKELKKNLEREGLKPGTFPYEAEFRRRHVELCKQKRGVDSCYNCDYFLDCELVKQHLVDLHYHRKEKK